MTRYTRAAQWWRPSPQGYSRLRVDLFRAEDYDLFDVDLRAMGEVTNLPRNNNSGRRLVAGWLQQRMRDAARSRNLRESEVWWA